MARWLAASSLVALSALAACASLDGLSDGVPDGGGNDAGTDAHPLSDAAPDVAVDAGADAAADARSDAPAGEAAADVADAPALHFCEALSPKPLFCEDFDEGSLTQGFGTKDEKSAAISLDLSVFSSPNASLRGASNANASGEIRADLTQPFVKTGLRYRLGYDLRPGAIDVNAQVIASQLQLLDGAGNIQYGVSFILRTGDATVEESSPGTSGLVFRQTGLPKRPANGRFSRVQLDVDFSVAKPALTVRLDGAIVLDQNPIPLTATNGFPTVDVGLAIYPAAAIGACDIWEDNVTFDVL